MEQIVLVVCTGDMLGQPFVIIVLLAEFFVKFDTKSNANKTSYHQSQICVNVFAQFLLCIQECFICLFQEVGIRNDRGSIILLIYN